MKHAACDWKISSVLLPFALLGAFFLGARASLPALSARRSANINIESHAP